MAKSYLRYLKNGTKLSSEGCDRAEKKKEFQEICSSVFHGIVINDRFQKPVAGDRYKVELVYRNRQNKVKASIEFKVVSVNERAESRIPELIVDDYICQVHEYDVKEMRA